MNKEIKFRRPAHSERQAAEWEAKQRELDSLLTDTTLPLWEVWSQGYRGHGATIPVMLGRARAKTLDDAARELDRVHGGSYTSWDGPVHATAEAAWAAYDAHWEAVGGVYAPDKTDSRRPASMRTIP